VYPITCLFIFGLIGPICEEITYRVGLFSLLKRKNRALAYLVTIAVFALIHFNFSNDPATLLNEIINLPYYMFAAFAFSFAFDKFGFAASATAHISNNLISLFLVVMAR
ncbi:MAG: CPBP family intramembrane metalloprotease, partial [Bacilli bacterium]|nr:CPBP family intramembrane metalloprotease [Bacilli bacterium]